ncbi:MAG: hypothetical protein WBA09_22355 [Candidatus Acidiferrum sp.]
MSEKKNSLATLEDFRITRKRNRNFSGAFMREFDAPEHVKLPVLGKEVLLRRPTPLWFTLNERVPVSLSEQVVPAIENGKPTVEKIKERAQWIKQVVVAAMVKPACTDELLELMDLDDALFIFRWAHGEIVAGEDGEAKSLDTFREERGPESAGTDGESVAVSPV